MATSVTSTGILYPDASVQTFAPGVKKIQNFYVNPYGTTSGDYSYGVNIPIDPVDTEKSIIIRPNTLQYVDLGANQFMYISVNFVNSSTINISQTFSYNTFTAFRFQIIEFY